MVWLLVGLILISPAFAEDDPCFSPDQVSQILSLASQPSVTRQTTLVIEQAPWETHKLGSYIASILMGELMNYTIQFYTNVTNQSSGALERIADGPVDINFEVWDEGERNSPVYEQYVVDNATVVDSGDLGTIGRDGLYVPDYLIDDDSSVYVDFFRSYNKEQLYDILRGPPVSVGLQVAPPFIPEWCVESTPRCPQLLASQPYWAQGVVPQIIRNLHWNMSAVYLGNYTNVTAVVKPLINAGEPAIFLQQSPSQFIYDNNVTRVFLPLNSLACYSNNTADPQGYGSVNCDWPDINLKKFYSIRISSDEQFYDALYYIFQHTLYEFDWEAMFDDLNGQDPTDARLRSTACKWLHNITNQDRWIQWIRNTPQRYVTSFDTDSVLVMRLLTAVLLLSLLIQHAAVIRYIRAPVIKHSEPKLLHTLFAGCYLGCLAEFAYSLTPDSTPKCASFITIASAGFVMVIGSCLLMATRLYGIFVRSSDSPLQYLSSGRLIFLFLWLSLDLVINLVWLTFDAPQPVRVPASGGSLEDVWECQFGYSLGLELAELIPKGLVLLALAYYSWQIRHVQHNFNEASKLVTVCYSIIILFLIWVTLYSSSSKNNDFLLTSVVGVAGLTITVSVIISPKLLWIYRAKPESLLTGSLQEGDLQGLDDPLLIGSSGGVFPDLGGDLDPTGPDPTSLDPTGGGDFGGSGASGSGGAENET